MTIIYKEKYFQIMVKINIIYAKLVYDILMVKQLYLCDFKYSSRVSELTICIDNAYTTT